MSSTGTNSGSGLELLIELDRRARRPLRAQLEDGLREAVRSGRLAAGTRLPPTRALAGDLGISRRLVVEAYSQLLAEGYLVARAGAGTFVAEAAAPAPSTSAEPPRSRLAFDFFPGVPDLAGFPRQAWLRALRETLREAPNTAFAYPDQRGAPELRVALAEHLRRVRGVVVEPERVVICAGVAQAFALLGQMLSGKTIAVEDPSLPVHRAILAANGARLAGVSVDEDGARVQELSRLEREHGEVAAAVVTPAHQSPTGVALSPARRSSLLAWAQDGGLVIEDDYDAEYRFDRAPLGALQGLAPERVIYTGTVSKTLAPALRIGWMVLPERLLDPLLAVKAMSGHGSPTIDQLALGKLLSSGAYDRHLRAARRRYRSRRDALVEAMARHLPGARVTGLAAGLHALVRLAHPVDGLALMRAASARSVGVYPLGYGYLQVRPVDDGLILGYANVAEPAIEEGIRRLALALGGLPTNDGGAMLR